MRFREGPWKREGGPKDFPIRFQNKRHAREFWAWLEPRAACEECGATSRGNWEGWAFGFQPAAEDCSDRPTIKIENGDGFIEIQVLCPDHAQIITRSPETGTTH